MVKALKLPESLLVGTVALLLLLVLTLGFQQAFNLLFISIICTLGISLSVWVGIAILLGYVILLVVDAWRDRETMPTSETNGEVAALNDYVHRSWLRGASLDQIAPHLRRQGWSDDQIEQAYQRIQPDSSETA